MGLRDGLLAAAKNYGKNADKAEADAADDRQRASWLLGRAGVYRQAAIDFAMMADLAEQATASGDPCPCCGKARFDNPSKPV